MTGDKLKNSALKAPRVKRSPDLTEHLYRNTSLNITDIWKCNIHTGDINALICTKPSKLCYDMIYYSHGHIIHGLN